MVENSTVKYADGESYSLVTVDASGKQSTVAIFSFESPQEAISEAEDWIYLTEHWHSSIQQIRLVQLLKHQERVASWCKVLQDDPFNGGWMLEPCT
jgi:hypothetical protein